MNSNFFNKAHGAFYSVPDRKGLIVFFFFISSACFSQLDFTKMPNNKLAVQNILDSAMVSKYFVTTNDAYSIIAKPVFVKDSSYKYSSGVLRYVINYVATYVDSTSKGALFFSFEQYKDTLASNEIYRFMKTQHTNMGSITLLKDLGDEAYMQYDALNQPFIIVRKQNRVFKFCVYYLTDKVTFDRLLAVAKKVVAAH